MPKAGRVLSEEYNSRDKMTHVQVITPNGRLQALGRAVSCRRNIELGDQGIDTQSSQSGECAL